MKFYYVASIFDLKIFDNERLVVSKVFEICTEIYFFSLFFLKWKKYYNFTFDDTFKMYCCALCQGEI